MAITIKVMLKVTDDPRVLDVGLFLPGCEFKKFGEIKKLGQLQYKGIYKGKNLKKTFVSEDEAFYEIQKLFYLDLGV